MQPICVPFRHHWWELLRCFERSRQITSNESNGLETLESIRPQSKVASSYEVWFTAVYAALLKQSTLSSTDLSNVVELLQRVALTRPSALSDTDEAFFLSNIQQELDRAARSGLTELDKQRIDAITATSPKSGGPISAKGWLAWLGGFVSNIITPTSAQKDIVGVWLTVKPCAVAPELDEPAGRVSAALQQLGLAATADAATFTACKP